MEEEKLSETNKITPNNGGSKMKVDSGERVLSDN